MVTDVSRPAKVRGNLHIRVVNVRWRQSLDDMGVSKSVRDESVHEGGWRFAHQFVHKPPGPLTLGASDAKLTVQPEFPSRLG